MYKRLLGMGLMAALVGTLCTTTGCEDSNDDDAGTTTTTPPAVTAADFTGTWALYEGTIEGTPYWYVHFQSDGSFTISNESNGDGRRVYGTHTVTDGKLVGPFTNPGTGEGRVEATISGGIIALDFIEYWHDPYKVVPYVGQKL